MAQLDRPQKERWEARLLYAALLLFVVCRALRPMAETDLFFHLKLGDIIVSQHTIPFRNLFSFTFPSHPDLDLSWAFQALVSLCYRADGFAAIVVLKVGCVALTVVLVHHAGRRLGGSPAAAAAATALAIVTAEPRLVERPHLITFLGLGLVSCLLVAVRHCRRCLWLAPPLVLLWANFHAGVFLGVAVLLLDRLTAKLTGNDTSGWGELLGVSSLTAAATLLTPAGLKLPVYLLWHLRLGGIRNIEEFRSADPYNDAWFFVLLALCACGALLLRRAHLRLIVPVLLVAVLAWRSVRFVAEWAWLAAPFLALSLDRFAQGLAPLLSARTVQLAMTGLLFFGAGRERLQHPTALALSADVVPFSAIRFVTAHGLRARLYHDLDVGCYLLWEGWPRYQVFQDARLPAYPDSFHRALDETPLAADAFGRLLDAYGVDAALLDYPDINMRAGSFEPNQWALVYRQEDALVFARRIPRHAEVIARYEIPLQVRFRFAGGASVDSLPRPPAGSPIPQCEWDDRLAAAWAAEERPDRTLAARLAAVEHGCLTLEDVRREYGKSGAKEPGPPAVPSARPRGKAG